MKKLLKILLVIIVVTFLIILSFKNIIAKNVITNIVKSMTGLSLDIQRISVGIFNTKIDVEGLKVYNPPAYTDRTMVDIPEIYVDYDLGAFMGGNIHLEELRLYLKEVTVVKDKDAKLNINSLKPLKAKKKVPREDRPEDTASKMQIDVLRLKIENVIYKDYSQGTKPAIKEYYINIDERYTNISDPQKLAKLIIQRAIVKAALTDILDVNLEALQGDLGTLLKKTGGVLEKGAFKVLESGGEDIEGIGKGTLNKGKETASEAVDKLKKTFQGMGLPTETPRQNK